MLDTTLVTTNRVADKRARSRSQLFVDIKVGLMPPPLRTRPGRKTNAWPAYEIDAINRAEIAGASDQEIRLLVRHLIEQRAQIQQAA